MVIHSAPFRGGMASLSLLFHDPRFLRRCIPAIVALFSILFLTIPASAQQYANYYEELGPYCLGTGGATAGDPVDVATGGLHLSETIGVLPGRLPYPISWGFIGRDASNGPLGPGTFLSTDYFVKPSTIYNDGTIELFTPGNRHFIFQYNGTNAYLNRTDPEILGARLTRNVIDGGPLQTITYRLRWKTGMIFHFNSVGALHRIEDPFGNQINIERNTNGYPTRIYEPGGRQITFEYTGTRLSAVVLPLNRRWEFRYQYYAWYNEYLLNQVEDPKEGITGYVWEGYIGNVNFNRYPTGTPGPVPDPNPTPEPTPNDPLPNFEFPIPFPFQEWWWNWNHLRHWPFWWWDWWNVYISFPLPWETPRDLILPDPPPVPPADPTDPPIAFVEPPSFVTPTPPPSSTNLRPALIKIIDRAGRVRLHNFYDGDGRVTKQRMADGGEFNFTYNTNETVVQSPTGTVRYYFQWNPVAYGYNITRVTNALNETTEMFRDGPTNLVTRTTDWRGRTVHFTWDVDRGNLLGVSGPSANGGTVSVTATYDPTWNVPVYIQTSQGQTATYTLNGSTGALMAVQGMHGTTNFSYSQMGDLTQVNNALNQSTRFEYSTRGDLSAVIDAQGRRTEYQYDDASRRTAILFPKNSSGAGTGAYFSYNVMDQVTYTGNLPDGYVSYPEFPYFATRYDYDVEGNLVRLALPGNQKWEWQHDAMDRVKLVRDPHGRTSTVTYKPGGLLDTVTDRMGNRSVFTYTSGPRPYQVLFYRANNTIESSVEYHYDSFHRLESITDTATNSTYAWGYNAMDHVISETGPLGTVSWTLDDLGRRTSLTVPGQNPITYNYNTAGDLISMGVPGQISASYSHDALGRVTQETLWTGSSPTQTTSWTYWPAGAVRTTSTSYNYGIFSDSREFFFDSVGKMDRETFNGNERQYGYDLLGRLRYMNDPTLGEYRWNYDTMGNRFFQAGGGTVNQFQYDGKNRLTRATRSLIDGGAILSDVTASHDHNGNMTRLGNTDYTWDTRGNLTGISGPGMNATFTYDTFGRRLTKTVNSAPKPVLPWDGWATANAFATGEGMRSGEVLNAQGSLIRSPGGGSVPDATFDYLPFGEVAGTPSGVDLTRARWAGMEIDGTGLYYARHRYYHPELGRFISEDPVGLAGGANLFAYCGNDPINFIDPLGLWATGSYWGDVGEVFKGYGDAIGSAVNPVAWYNGAKGLYDKAYQCGIGSAMSALGEGIWHGYTDWLTTGDPRTFGQSFGNVLMTVGGAAAPKAVGILRKPRAGTECFPAGTPVVMADGTTKPIEQVQKGDEVLSRNQYTGATVVEHVSGISVHETDTLVTVELADASGKIAEVFSATPEHPLFVTGRGWVPIGEIAIGTQVVTRAGPTLHIKSCKRNKRPNRIRVYNFAVANTSSYFVGSANGGTWVHNNCYTTLYRAVGPNEGADIAATGRIRPGGGSMEAKWFAENLNDAVRWAQWFHKQTGKGYDIVEVRFRKSSVENVFREPNLDQIGPARAIDPSRLSDGAVREIRFIDPIPLPW